MAANAEIKSKACTWGFRSRNVSEKENTEYIIESVNEILKIVGVN